MKKIVLSLALLGASSLFADYQLTLIDKDGIETNQCIKSYSFSNNLESLARQNSLGTTDIYSEEETLTNKTYLGKPVYRRVFTNLRNFIPNNSNQFQIIPFNNESDNVENIVFSQVKFNNYSQLDTWIHTYNSQLRYYIVPNGLKYVISDNQIGILNSTASVIMEYTKTTDETPQSSSSNSAFKSFLHYQPSSSTEENIVTINIKNTGVRFLEGYTYDSLSNTCIKN